MELVLRWNLRFLLSVSGAPLLAFLSRPASAVPRHPRVLCNRSYSINSNPFDLYAVALFGLLGYTLTKLGCEPAPLLLGFVLGLMIEENLRRAMIISHGDPTVFVTRPLSAVLIAIAAGVLVLLLIPSISRRREVVFRED